MKKIIFTLAAAAMIAMTSCDSKQSTATDTASTDEGTTPAESTEAVEAVTEATPQVAIDPYLAKLMQSDTTIHVTPSGLGYKVVKEGNGSRPNRSNTVKVNYTGKHKDGSVFDSSEGRGPADFPLSGVIPGFSEGIALMPTGSVYTLYIPGNLGYGPTGTPGGPIAPNEFLIFDVELLSFE